MTEVASRLPSRFDHGILRLAREIRAEVAEALASRGTAPAGGQQLDGSGTVATARRLAVVYCLAVCLRVGGIDRRRSYGNDPRATGRAWPDRAAGES